MIDVVLVDDHRLFREGLRRLLSSDGRFRVVGEAADGVEFLALLGSPDKLNSPADARSTDNFPAGSLRQPPLVFMDIDMPSMGGIEATEKALARWPSLRIVGLSMHGEEEFYAPMMAAGAVGFLMKDSTLEQVAAAALTALGLPPTNNPPSSEALSERERDVLPLICAGLSTSQIAERLFISPRTVDKHRASILSKTSSPNTASLVVWAVRHGLITV